MLCVYIASTIQYISPYTDVYGLPQSYYCPATLCKRGICRHAVYASVCLSVCLSVTFVHFVKTNYASSIFFNVGQPHHSSFFPYQTLWRYSYGNLSTNGVDEQGSEVSRDFSRKSAIIAHSGHQAQPLQCPVTLISCCVFVVDFSRDQWRFMTSLTGNEIRDSCVDEIFFNPPL